LGQPIGFESAGAIPDAAFKNRNKQYYIGNNIHKLSSKMQRKEVIYFYKNPGRWF